MRRRRRRKKEEEGENKEKIRMNPEDSETKEAIKPSSQDVQSSEEREKRDIGELVKLSLKDLRKIEEKMKNGTNLDEQDIRTLYAGKINRWNPTSRIRGWELACKLLEKRKSERRQDLALIFNTTEDRISFTEEEALSGDTVCHYGDLDLRHIFHVTSAEDLKLPKNVIGDLNLRSLRMANGLELPEIVSGSLDLSHLTTAEGLVFPKIVGGSLGLFSLTDGTGLNLPEIVGDHLLIPYLFEAKDLNFPETVGGRLDLDNLTTAKNLNFPKNLGGSLQLRKLAFAEGLNFPDKIGIGNVLYIGSLEISRLPHFNGITNWPSYIKDSIHTHHELSEQNRSFLEKKYPGVLIHG